MSKYAVKIQQPNVSADNYAIMTFTTTAPDGAARVAALVIGLQQTSTMATSRIVDIVKSDGPGAGTLVVPTLAEVNAVLEEMSSSPDGIQFEAITGSVLGVDRGPEGQQCPLGISLLLTETAVSGPKGRVYMPYPTAQSINTTTGRPLPLTLQNFKKIFEAAYGLAPLSEVVPSFYVTSGGGNSQSLIASVNASQSYAYLRSRSR